MAGSIDPRCETLRGIHWPVKVAGLFGTRVAETILASGPPNRINRPDIWMQAIRSDHQKLLRHGGRPHMDPLARKGRWFVWNSRRGNHLGQRSTKPHQQAGHMDASDPIRPSKTLAAWGPSTYGSPLSRGRRQYRITP